MIAIGCDHAGYELKEIIRKHLTAKGKPYKDFGTFDSSSVDYPDYAFYVGRAVASGEYPLGILICGTGIGISIAANKIPGIRAANCADLFSAEYSRRHNDANILALGARVLKPIVALQLVDKFLETPFDGGRHQGRVDKIKTIEDMMAVERAEQIARMVQKRDK